MSKFFTLSVGCGGDRGTRTPNLGIANAALSQLSYIPRLFEFIGWRGSVCGDYSNRVSRVSIKMLGAMYKTCYPVRRYNFTTTLQLLKQTQLTAQRAEQSGGYLCPEHHGEQTMYFQPNSTTGNMSRRKPNQYAKFLGLTEFSYLTI